MSTSENDTIMGGKAAVTLGAVLLVGFAGMAWLTSLDRAERKELEMLQSPSAAGEPFVAIPAGEEVSDKPVVILLIADKEVPHYGEDIVNHSDGTMMKSGLDVTGKITTYQRVRRNKLQKELFIKIGPGRFLEIAPREEKAIPAISPEAKPAAPAESAESE